MMDRPARNISLRQFRDRITEITDVVEVSRRDDAGNILLLGVWTPYIRRTDGADELIPPVGPSRYEPDLIHDGESEPFELKPRIVRSPEEAAQVVAALPTRGQPYPKDAQTRRRRRR